MVYPALHVDPRFFHGGDVDLARLSAYLDGLEGAERDAMRGISTHISIGRATREGKPMDNWFVLCRQ